MTLPLVLGIETSCDETGVGLVRGRDLLADAVASSVDQHARFGGVVPEVASRAHLEAMLPTFDRALATAGVTAGQIDAVAVTAGPGLAGALLVCGGVLAVSRAATARRNLPDSRSDSEDSERNAAASPVILPARHPAHHAPVPAAPDFPRRSPLHATLEP